MMEKVKIGITIGDINGIGPEVIIKALSHPKMREICVPIIYGSAKAMSYHKNTIKGADFSFISTSSPKTAAKHKINVINCWDETVNISLGKMTEECGKYAYIALDRAVEDLKNGALDALVTGPINKKAMKEANFPHNGHTEYLTEKAGQKSSLMILANDNLRVATVTGHIPVKSVASTISKELVEQKLNHFHRSLQKDFGLDKPRIAVLGLNPHAGDDGVLGDEEDQVIRPIIIAAKKNGQLVMGPYSADGFFGNQMHLKVDGVLAMYHDQGLIPFKTISFGNGVNITAGLPFVRTSPDHGVAYDIAGMNKANEESMRSAIFAAIDIIRNRKQFKILQEEKTKKPKPSEEVSNEID